MTPTPSPNDINRIIDLIQNSGNDQQIMVLLLIVLIMVGSVALLLVVILRYKPNLGMLLGGSKSPASTLDKLVDVLAEFNENFQRMIEQEDKRITMREDDLRAQKELREEDLKTHRESMALLHQKLDQLLERK